MSLNIIAIALGGLLIVPLPAIAQNPEHVERLLETGSCSSCDLSGADLSDRDLSDAYLPGAFLFGTDLTNTNLRGANLRRALMNGAILDGADLSFSDLTDASLEGARMSVPAEFTGATMDGLVMPDGRIRETDSDSSTDEEVREIESSQNIENILDNEPSMNAPAEPSLPDANQFVPDWSEGAVEPATPAAPSEPSGLDRDD
jgi:hypothetical protein